VSVAGSPARYLAAAALLALLAPPLAAQEWHEDYRNGLRALAQGRGERAVELLHLAVNKRPQPGVNVVTYGTNVEPRYFPYLSLAEAYLMTGRLEAARNALAVSEKYGIEPESERAAIRARVSEAEAAAARVRATPPPAPSPAPTPTPVERVPAATPTVTPAATAWASPPPAAPTPAAAATPARPVARATAPPVAPRASTPPSASPAATPAPTTGEPSPAAAAGAGAALELLSLPRRAEVYLDDERVGVTDPEAGRLLASGLVPGRHRLRVALPGHADHVAEIDLAGGRTATYRVTLMPQGEREPALPFAFLALAGVIVAAGVGVFVWLRAGRAGRDTTLFERLTGSVRRRATPAPVDPRATPGRTPLPPGGERFGDYLLVDVLGRGGMATVYRAERRGESVALKRPLPRFLDEPEFMERFLREAEIGRTLHHPNIVSIFERGDVGGTPYFTMELVPGETLQAWLRRQRAVPLRRAAEIVSDVAEALDYAHLKGVIHRDLKPSNIMLLPAGAAKVMDYGIARARRFDGLTVTGAFLGTPDYVAPEIIEGRGSTPKSDIYALGVILYELIAGRRPFEADTPFTILRKHCSEPPPPPSSLRAGLPPELEALVVRLLAKEPDERYDAESLLVALREWLNRAT
jgi:tRNA A-37 threonylcarbamoyl transferase component Bud32